MKRFKIRWRCGICGEVHNTRTKPLRCECGNAARFYAFKEEDSDAGVD